MNTHYRTPILIVESDPDEVARFTRYLVDAGIKPLVSHAENLLEGFEMIKSHDFDLVILDINLPDCQGFKTITTYFERAPNVPVVIVSDVNNDVISNQAVKAGAQDFLLKSQINSKGFGRAVRFAIQRSKVQLQLEATAHALELSRTRYLEAQQMAQLGTWEMDLVTNQMKWSDVVFRIFSFHPGTISPTLSDYLNYVHFEDRPMVEAFFEDLTKDTKLHQLEHRITVEGINTRFLNLQGKVQMDGATGKIILVGSLQDNTDRKLAEKLIIEKNISNKTAKIQEDVLADLSFQIRTPLSSVVNLLFLMENTEKSKQQASYLDNLKTSVDDLALSVNNLLNFSVMVSDNVKLEEVEFNIREFLSGAKNVVALKAAAANICLEMKAAASLPEKIIADPKKLTQVLYNLLDNAVKFTKAGGKVILSAQPEELAPAKMNLVLRISDTGRGIEKEKVKQLLEADKLLEMAPDELEESNKKRQLGVAIVSKLTKTMGGKMSIESKLGAGSQFIIELPVRLPRQSRLAGGNAPDAPLKILLVEDHFLNQIATKKVLTSWSDFVSVDIAENGQIGVDKFIEYGYDIVLMDIQMPVMNGFEAAKKIRAHSDVPIIALTANSTNQERSKCLEIGMNDYLAKPFKPQDLFDRILGMMALVPG